jgi:hypothetical protein
MVRLFALIANLLFALILKIGFSDDIGVTLEVPNEVVAGTEFEVRVMIKKGRVGLVFKIIANLTGRSHG